MAKLGEVISFIVLALIVVVGIFGLFKLEKHFRQDYILEKEYNEEATIEYCDRHNICGSVEVNSYDLVYTRTIGVGQVNWYIRFELNGETLIYKTENIKVIEGD